MSMKQLLLLISFFEKYGYCQKSKRCVHTQFIINGSHFSVIAAYTPFGFLCWEIIEGAVCDSDFIHFLHVKFAPLISPDDAVVLVDNCSIHKTVLSLEALEIVSNGYFEFCAPYSPDYKPIERGFCLIKMEIRSHEDEAVQDPVFYINAAFDLYKVGGLKSAACFKHWNIYERIRYSYLCNF
eukprot:gene17401-24052_t